MKDIGVCINPQVQVKNVQVRRWLRGGGYVDCVGLLGEGSKNGCLHLLHTQALKKRIGVEVKT